MSDQDRLRQFWLRLHLGFGVFWGLLPLVMLPFISRAEGDNDADLAVVVFDSLTVLPACFLGFWFRRPMCVWLGINAVALLWLLQRLMQKIESHPPGVVIGILIPVYLAAALIAMELRRWPKATNIFSRQSKTELL